MVSRLLIFLLAGLAAVGSGLAQSSSQPLPPVRSVGIPALPPPARLQTPVDLFRELLAMKPAEREKAMASRSSQTRLFLEAKIKEFEALPTAAREERLQTLQLRWHLLPLMKLPPALRAARLEAMSENDRKLVQARLELWDLLPEGIQRQVRENENVIRLFFRFETNASRPSLSSTNLSPAQRDQMEKDQARWQAMSDPERQRILAHFQRFFELNAREKARIVKEIADVERRQMAMTLQRFAWLPASQREACVRGFEKFAALSPSERQQFLSNAERWQAMSPKDRQLWRELVDRLGPQPPQLPAVRRPKSPASPGNVPMPPPPKPRASASPALTTN